LDTPQVRVVQADVTKEVLKAGNGALPLRRPKDAREEELILDILSVEDRGIRVPERLNRLETLLERDKQLHLPPRVHRWLGGNGQLRLVGNGPIRLEQLTITTGKKEREKGRNGKLTHGTPPYGVSQGHQYDQQ
jgi:hypothetical protein